MSTFDETSVRRQPQGVSTGGQFATQPKSESDVTLTDHGSYSLSEGQEVAIANPLSNRPAWLHGTVTHDAPVGHGQIGVVVTDGDQSATYVVDARTALPDIEPAEYDGEDVDQIASAWSWTAKDWEAYYDGRAERNGIERDEYDGEDY